MTKYRDPEVTCTTDVGDVNDEEDWVRPCGKASRFVVARSDGDSSFGANGGSEEACEEHLHDAVLGMVDGDETVSAVITVRWGDAAEAHGGPGGPRGPSFSCGPGPVGCWLWRQLPRSLADRFSLAVGDRVEC